MEPDEGILKRIIDVCGPEGLRKYIAESLERSKKTELNIAFTGRSGVGKSSLVNALRGLSDEDAGAAKTGVIETTLKAQKYPHPRNKSLVLWDLPGVGTQNYPMGQYMSSIDFGQFDIFMIVTAHRFMEVDLWLAQQVKAKGKGFIFVRTQIDTDVTNKKKSKISFKGSPDEVKLLVQTVRDNCFENLQEEFGNVVDKELIFVIDNLERENPLYDFDKLARLIIDTFPSLKRDALILSITAMTTGIVDAKTQLLRDQILKRSLGGIILSTDVSHSVYVANVKAAAEDFQDQLGLDEVTLRTLAHSIGLPFETMIKEAGLQTIPLRCSRDDLKVMVLRPFYFRLLRIIGDRHLYNTTKHSVLSILEKISEDRKKLLKYVGEQSLSGKMLYYEI